MIGAAAQSVRRAIGEMAAAAAVAETAGLREAAEDLGEAIVRAGAAADALDAHPKAEGAR